MNDIEMRLRELNIKLPETTVSLANYLPYRVVDGMVHVSGQLPFQDGVLLHPGEVGKEISVDQAKEAARLCGLHLLAQAKAACGGDWSRLISCVKLGGFVQAGVGFTQHPEVINGASDLMVEILGGEGRHARFAVGAASLPRNACVEIDAVFEVSVE